MAGSTSKMQFAQAKQARWTQSQSATAADTGERLRRSRCAGWHTGWDTGWDTDQRAFAGSHASWDTGWDTGWDVALALSPSALQRRLVGADR